MTRTFTIHHRATHAIVAAVVATTAFAIAASPAGEAEYLEKLGGSTNTAQARIPESMRAEHERIHSSLVRATKLPGPVGTAARQLADILHPHFVREEQIALPPLGLLEPLVRGSVTPDVRAVLAMTDSLRTELPRMLEEHKAIRAATIRLGDVARRARNTTVVALTEELRQHAQTEEEILYPAAVLVGEVVRARSGAARTSASR